jgi:hypothetical protein
MFVEMIPEKIVDRVFVILTVATDLFQVQVMLEGATRSRLSNCNAELDMT